MVVIVAILITMLLPAYRWYRERTYRINCAANLKTLYIAAGAYVQANSQWPQIRMVAGGSKDYSKAWIEALKPYGIAHVNWICPAAQRALGGPDFTKKETFRVDYSAGTFDEHASTPYKWAKQPWFVERTDLHGRGPLLIMSDGSLMDMRDAMLLKNDPPK